MKKFLLSVVCLATILASLGVYLTTQAAGAGFALIAVSDNKISTRCVKNSPTSVLEALKEGDFNPKQDDSGFIYSLIGFDAPPSTDPASRERFWSFWLGQENLSFSTLGPAQVIPQEKFRYVFSLGNGSSPKSVPSFSEVCPPAQQTPPPSPAPKTQPLADQPSAITKAQSYLLATYQSQSGSEKDWAALALGLTGQKVAASPTSGTDVLTLSRSSLALAAQGVSPAAQVEKIKLSYQDRQLGQKTLINDDIFGLLAIATTDREWVKTHQDILETIAASQRGDGSFGFSNTGGGDADMTAAVLWALQLGDQTKYQNQINQAFGYLAKAQNGDGGVGYQPAAESNIASTAWAMIAYTYYQKPTVAISAYVTNQQQSDGSWLSSGQKSYLFTAYALLALSQKPLPIQGVSSPPPNTIGKQQTSTRSQAQTQARANRSSTNDRPVREFTCQVSASASASATASGEGASASASASASVRCN